jgi:hypothetical protein
MGPKFEFSPASLLSQWLVAGDKPAQRKTVLSPIDQ